MRDVDLTEKLFFKIRYISKLFVFARAPMYEFEWTDHDFTEDSWGCGSDAGDYGINWQIIQGFLHLLCVSFIA